MSGNTPAKAFGEVPVSTKQANAIDDLNKRDAREAGITDASATKRQKNIKQLKIYKYKQSLLVPLEIPFYLYKSANALKHNSGSCSSSPQVYLVCS